MSTLANSIIDAAIDEVNDAADGGALVQKTPSTALLGPDSTIDSLTLVRLLVTVERLIEELAGKSVTVVDESAFEAEISPFATVQALADHVTKLIA